MIGSWCSFCVRGKSRVKVAVPFFFLEDECSLIGSLSVVSNQSWIIFDVPIGRIVLKGNNMYSTFVIVTMCEA